MSKITQTNDLKKEIEQELKNPKKISLCCKRRKTLPDGIKFQNYLKLNVKIVAGKYLHLKKEPEVGTFEMYETAS